MDDKWPKKGDTLFMCDNYNPRSPDQANLGWLKYHKEDYLSWSFKEAGDLIIRGLEDGRNELSHADILFFPICYLYRHVIELELKGIIELGINLGILQESNRLTKLLGCHSLYIMGQSRDGIKGVLCWRLA